jgi:hypothetical protein
MPVMPIRLGGHAIVVLLGLIGIAGVMTATLVTASPARAATAYRYWSFYIAHGSTWQYSARGPATEFPVDGEVQGWRFAVQADAGNGLQPRIAPSFATLCASTPAKSGAIRIGVVLDFGTAIDAPAHDHPPATVVPGCVYIADGGTGAAALQAAASVRIGTGADAGLVCGIDGYPTTECAVAVAAPAPVPPATPAPTRSAAAHAPATATPNAAPVAPSPVASSAAPRPPTAVASSAPLAAAASHHPSTSASALASPPVESTLVALRTNAHHRFPVMAVVGGVLVVALGGGAVWRARAGRQ